MTKRTLLSVALTLALTACSGGGSSRVTPQLGGAVNPGTGTVAPSSTLKIVGVGDSLTAGEQSQGLMGADVNPNPFFTGTATGSPFPIVQATQTHGFWGLLWSNANGGTSVANIATSPLPLISPPGLGQILVPKDATGSLTSITSACGQLNGIAYTYATALQARLNPGTVPLDVAIPGQTVHEALYQIQPETACAAQASTGPFAGLANLVNPESQQFYSVLGNFPQGTTQVGAAAGLHGSIDTVWLGSNDLLKFALSEGALVPTAPSAMQTDMVAIINALKVSGAKVVVANLTDVLHAAFFLPQPAFPSVFTAKLAPVIGLQAAVVAGPQLAAAVDATYGLGPNGFLTISGLSKVLGTAAVGAPLPQLTAGDLLSDGVAVQVQQLNDGYNAAIGAAVTQTGATLVDVHAAVQQIAASPTANFPFGSYPVNPPVCCGLGYGQGFFSLDGIHPSNTGYAIIANLFISTMHTALGTNIPPVDVAAVYAGDIYAPH